MFVFSPDGLRRRKGKGKDDESRKKRVSIISTDSKGIVHPLNFLTVIYILVKY